MGKTTRSKFFSPFNKKALAFKATNQDFSTLDTSRRENTPRRLLREFVESANRDYKQGVFDTQVQPIDL